MKTILILFLFLLPISSPYSKAEETAEEKSYYTKASEYIADAKSRLFSEYCERIGYIPSDEDMEKAKETILKLPEYCPAMTSKKCLLAAVSLSVGIPLGDYIVECKNQAKECLDKFVEKED
ncbi:MAG: hypothetical protein OXH82_01150 [Candidatus Dadabacteria bacterium]|nr:hypothetical protein [Candidatus Dadabacteria bacterium]MDE0662525.1 hypothetical protein [Candidatus Dadabacteria bacterium]